MPALKARLPDEWKRVTTLDLHTEGEPLRLVLSGVRPPEGVTVAGRRIAAIESHQALRRLLMLEPRGHSDMYGAILTEADDAGGDAGVLFMHNDGFSTMCGHGVIAVCHAICRHDLLPTARADRVVLDTPAGRVFAHVDSMAGENQVRFINVPSFVVERNLAVTVGGQSLRLDLAFGGAYYAFVNAEDCDLKLEPHEISTLVQLGKEIKQAVAAKIELKHPLGRHEAHLGAAQEQANALGFLYGVIFCGQPDREDCHSRHVCVFADGEVDRSPTGTGVSARAALLHDAGDLALGQEIQIQSLVGGRFGVRIVGTTSLGAKRAVLPEVSGRAWVTGQSEWVVDPADEFQEGFLLR